MSSYIKYPVMLGCLFVLLYAVMSAISFVVVGKVEQTLSPMTLAFYSFIISAVFFNVASLRNFSNIIKMFKQHYRLIILMNISTAILWLATFYGLRYLDPAIFSGLVFGFVPISATLLTANQPKTKPIKRTEFIFSVALLLILILLAIDDFLKQTSLMREVLSITFAMVGGLTAAHVTILARRLSQLGYKAMEVLSIRFYLLIIVALLMVPVIGLEVLLPRHHYYAVVSIAAISVAIPLYCLQKGIERIDAVFVTLIMPFVPMLTYVVQLTVFRVPFSWTEFILLLALSATILTSIIIKGHLQSLG